MATVVRASQNNALLTSTGGVRNPDSVIRPMRNFMEAVERDDTPFLNSLKHLGSGNAEKHEWGIQGLVPRDASVGTTTTAAATTIVLTAGHGARVRPSSLLILTVGTAQERVWVRDVTGDTVTVVRGIGGDTALIPTAGNAIRISSSGLPQLAKYPLMPFSTGDLYFNYWQRLAGKNSIDIRANNTPDYEINGTRSEKQMVRIAARLKEELEEALILGRRRVEDPNPAAPIPSFMSGLYHFAELSGNVSTVTGAPAKLSIFHLEDLLATLDLAYGTKAPSKLLMSMNTKRILNRIIKDYVTRRGDPSTTSVSLVWKSVELETGTYSFAHTKNIPDGKILIYNPAACGYRHFAGCDWQEHEIEVDAPVKERAIFGDFSFEVEAPKTLGLIQGFSTNLADYPLV